ncbi:DUF4397 domain-containing protein [Chitinophaga solisilvae]|uniref:DUF4397 domain-containing protein n=1 Tax=Chitinophaga solisilvae TaxID=1233460 RepID=UPI00136BC8F8|nr:DUF4397 domain-containing protein [Chitinophaga solisilvae]
MKYFIQLLTAMMCLAVTFTACTDREEAVLPASSPVAFYNASQLLRQELERKNPGIAVKPAFILVNTPVPVKPDTLRTAERQYMPYFAVSISGQQFYPMLNVAPRPVPWISYMRVTPGMQELIFLKPDTTPAVKTVIDAGRDVAQTVFLTDSLGIYRTIVTHDSHPDFDKGVSLRIVQAAPDTGLLRVRVNRVWLGDSWAYGTASGYYHLPLADSLSSTLYTIQVTPAGDTSNVLKQYLLKAGRSQSYTLIINGYLNYHEETNYASPDFRLSFIRNK